MAPDVQKSSSFPKTSLVGPSRNIDKSQPLYLQGDELIYDNGGSRVIARGNVEIYYNNYILTADQVVYDQSANTLTAVGNVELKEPNGNIVRADRYTLTDDFRDGFVQSLSVVATDDTRIAAEQAFRRGGNVTVFKNGRFTPCRSSEGMPPLWCISAGTVTHDQQAQTISYQDATFDVFGVPILYMPYCEHADPSVKRKSGFLMPEFSSSETLGFGAVVPYYFALAPNYDFTFYPMYTSRQGVLWQGDWRHRLENGQYYVKMAGIDQDAADLPSAITNRDQYDGWRGSIETKGLFSLSSWWKFGWDVTLESDDTFRRFYKLDNILLTDRVNRVFMEGISDRNYMGIQLYHFGGLMFNDQPNSFGQSESYAYPIVDYNYVMADPIVGGELTWNTNVLSFTDNQDPAIAAVGSAQMNRVVTEVNWRRRFTDAIGITYTPFGQLRGDLYQLNNYVDPAANAFDPLNPPIVGDPSPARGRALGAVPQARPASAGGAAAAAASTEFMYTSPLASLPVPLGPYSAACATPRACSIWVLTHARRTVYPRTSECATMVDRSCIGRSFSSAALRIHGGSTSPEEMTSSLSRSHAGNLPHRSAMSLHRGGSRARRALASSTCGAPPLHSATSDLQSSHPRPTQLRARPSRPSTMMILMPSWMAYSTAARSTTPMCADCALRLASRSSFDCASAHVSRARTSGRDFDRNMMARSFHTWKSSPLTVMSSLRQLSQSRALMRISWGWPPLPPAPPKLGGEAMLKCAGCC